MGIAYPAVDPRRVLAMRADLVFRLLEARAEIVRAASQDAETWGHGDAGIERTVDRTRITDVEQLKSFFSRPLNG